MTDQFPRVSAERVAEIRDWITHADTPEFRRIWPWLRDLLSDRTDMEAALATKDGEIERLNKECFALSAISCDGGFWSDDHGNQRCKAQDALRAQLAAAEKRIGEVYEECAKIAERDVNWAEFGMGAAIKNAPEIFESEPAERNVTIYRSSICAGSAIAAHIRARATNGGA